MHCIIQYRISNASCFFYFLSYSVTYCISHGTPEYKSARLHSAVFFFFKGSVQEMLYTQLELDWD